MLKKLFSFEQEPLLPAADPVPADHLTTMPKDVILYLLRRADFADIASLAQVNHRMRSIVTGMQCAMEITTAEYVDDGAGGEPVRNFKSVYVKGTYRELNSIFNETALKEQRLKQLDKSCCINEDLSDQCSLLLCITTDSSCSISAAAAFNFILYYLNVIPLSVLPAGIFASCCFLCGVGGASYLVCYSANHQQRQERERTREFLDNPREENMPGGRLYLTSPAEEGIPTRLKMNNG